MATLETDPLELEIDEIVFKDEPSDDITDLTGPDLTDPDITELDLTDDETSTSSVKSFPVVHTQHPTELNFTQRINPVAVVYTKRLDDMNILKQDLDGMSAKNIIECIRFESIPLFDNFTKHNKRAKSENSFKRVVEKLNQINNIGFREVAIKNEYKEEVRKRNRKLLEMCKPVKIILKRVELPYKPTCPSAKSNQNKNSLPSKKAPVMENPSSNGSSQFQEFKLLESNMKGKAKQFNSTISIKSALRNIFLLFFDSDFNQVDGYFVDCEGIVTDFFSMDGKPDYEQVLSYTGEHKVIKMMFCCWFERENLIMNLSVQFIPLVTAKFMRKVHKCVPGYCQCCCQTKRSDNGDATTKNTSQTPSVSCGTKIITPSSIVKDRFFIEATDEIKFLKDELSELSQDKSVWLQKLIKNNTSNTLINKALKYTRPKCPKMFAIPANNTPKSLLLYFQKWENEIDCYEITQDGNVVTHLKERGFGYLAPKTVKLHKSCEDYIDKKDIRCTKSCCWYSQTNSQLQHTKLLKAPAAMKFIRESHPCPRGHCICCCRDRQNSFTVRLSQIAFPEHARYVENVSRKTYGTKNKPMNSEAASQLPNSVKVLPYSVPVQFDKETNTSQRTNTFRTVIQEQKTMESEKPANASQDKVVDSLITTILDRFQDVRLTINSDGKVAAALTTPVSNLSTAELKVLADILSHAQEQVKALGLGPGANLNHHLNLNQNIKNTIQSDNLIKTMQQNAANIVNRQNQPLIKNTIIRPNTVNTNVNRPQTNFNSQGASIRANAVYKSFTDMTYQKNRNFNNAFQCHLQATGSVNNNCIPRIENVFSLQDTAKTNVGEKRKSFDEQLSSNSKIRVLSPTKLGASSNINNTPSVMVGNPSQTQTFQINTSVPQSSVSHQPTIMINSGTIQLVPQSKMLQHMLTHGTNLSNTNMLFSQPAQMNTNTILIPQTVPVSNAVGAAQIQYNTPVNVMGTSNINVLQGTNPRPMQMPMQTVNNIQMAGSLIRVNDQSTFDSNIKMTPVLLKQQQLHNEMATLKKCNPIATAIATPKVQMTELEQNDDDDDVKTEPQESTDEFPPDEKILIDIEDDEFEDAACILGM